MSTSAFPKPSHVPITSRTSLYLPILDGEDQPAVEAFGNAHLPSEATDPLSIPTDAPGTYVRFAAAPITGAMWPAYPAGRLAVFLDAEQRHPEDGETVYAALSVRATPPLRRWWHRKVHPPTGFTCITVIRRYGHDEQGRVTLTPLQPGFESWTQGEHDGTQAEILVLGVAAGYKPRGFHIAGVHC